MSLAPRIEPAVDTDRAIALALVHDAPEAVTGDFPRSASQLLPEGAKRIAEDRAAERVLAPLSDVAIERWRELRAGETREARLVGVCDRLQLGIRLVGYLRSGARGLEEFRTGLEDLDCSEFEPAAALRAEILEALDELDG